jgi:hypothetical protein
MRSQLTGGRLQDSPREASTPAQSRESIGANPASPTGLARSRESLLVLASIVVLVGIVFLTTPLTSSRRGFDSDGRYYGSMAGETSFPAYSAPAAPWCHRVLTPYLASLLPGPVLQRFRMLAFASSVMSLWVLFLIFRRLTLPLGASALGILMYSGVFWALRFSFFSPAYIDYNTQLLLLLIVLLTLADSYRPLLPVLALSALQKESLVLFGILPVIRLLQRPGARGWPGRIGLAGSLLLTPLATWLAIRALIPAESSESGIHSLMREGRRMLDPGFWPIMVQAGFSGLGLTPILLCVSPVSWLEKLKAHKEWWVWAALSGFLLLGGTDKGRLFLYGLPLLVVLGATSASALQARSPRRLFTFWCLMVLVPHWLIGGLFGRLEPVSAYLARMVPEHSGGAYLPFLLRNALLGAAALGLSLAVARRARASR